MVTFSPTGGNTFDGFGGTLTTAIACLRTGRGCVVVESDKACFDLAVQRLYGIYKELYGVDPVFPADMQTVLQEKPRYPQVAGTVQASQVIPTENSSDEEYEECDHDTAEEDVAGEQSQDSKTGRSVVRRTQPSAKNRSARTARPTDPSDIESWVASQSRTPSGTLSLSEGHTTVPGAPASHTKSISRIAE